VRHPVEADVAALTLFQVEGIDARFVARGRHALLPATGQVEADLRGLAVDPNLRGRAPVPSGTPTDDELSPIAAGRSPDEGTLFEDGDRLDDLAAAP
jgi:hypothetical protein